MAMERLRAHLMQQDQFGIYRSSTSSNPISSSTGNPLPRPGDISPTNWTFQTSEASAYDHYGHPDFCPVGKIFPTRKACYDAKVHRHHMKGIVGNNREGAFSVVANEGYEDDIDEGDTIWYTGAGGQESRWGGLEHQRSDQSFDHPSNSALERNTQTRHPVRVIRGSRKCSQWGPRRGYRYDGLYDVLQADYVKGKSGYSICRFKLQRRPGQTALQDLPRE